MRLLSSITYPWDHDRTGFTMGLLLELYRD